jgi:hypothetical protein
MNRDLGDLCNHIVMCLNAYDDLNAVYLYVYLTCGKKVELLILVSIVPYCHP